MLQCEVLISELLAIDALATGAIASSEVTSLKHELGDDPVEAAALEAEALLTRAKGAEVLCITTSGHFSLFTQLRLATNEHFLQRI